GHRFSTNSDSEVILHLYEEEGPRCLARMNGMFAFAIWDGQRRQLFVARDRMGIKPLYYAQVGSRFLFASEIKSLLAFRDLQTTLNPQAVHNYLALRYVPGPETMFKEIHKFPQAHYAVIKDGTASFQRFWAPELYNGPFEGS